MRIRKSKLRHPGLPPDKVEALGLMTPEELAACHVKVAEIREPGTPPFGLQAPARAAADGKRSAAAAAGEPPLLIGGESPRRPHRGKGAGTPDFPGYSESVVLHNGKPVIVPGVRTVKGQKVGIDWVSCVFEAKEAWQYFFLSELQGEQPEKNDDARTAKYVRDVFSWILGFDREEGVSKVYANGLNGYKYAIGMPNGTGVVHSGHASATCLVTVSGQGALSAVPGWEHRLHRFLSDDYGIVRGRAVRLRRIRARGISMIPSRRDKPDRLYPAQHLSASLDWIQRFPGAGLGLRYARIQKKKTRRSGLFWFAVFPALY